MNEAEVADQSTKRQRIRCGFCGQFMRKDYRAPGDYACSQMAYSHYYGSWEHQ